MCCVLFSMCIHGCISENNQNIPSAILIVPALTQEVGLKPMQNLYQFVELLAQLLYRICLKYQSYCSSSGNINSKFGDSCLALHSGQYKQLFY